MTATSRHPDALASDVPRASAWTVVARALAVAALLVAALLSWRFAAAVWLLGTIAILALVAIAASAFRRFRA
jgi:hypothetical protein